MFQLPVEKNDLDDRIEVREGFIRIRSYGLPMVFWGYLAAIFAVLFFMYLAIRGPINSILAGDDVINRSLAYLVILIFTLGPIILLSFFFYEKEILKEQNILTITHRIFFIPLKRIKLDLRHKLTLKHFLDSPNVAKSRPQQGMAGFENRGYYLVTTTDDRGKEIMVDRNSRKGEMNKLIKLLES